MWEVLRLLTRTLGEKAVLRRSADQIRAIQRRRLRNLVRHAKAHSPFYADRLAGVDPDRFELADIPPVIKAELMADFDRVPTDRRLTRAGLEAFMADPARLGEWYLGEYAVSRTSGTQGCPAIIVQDRSMMEVLFALQMGRGSTFRANPWTALERFVRPARLAVVTIGRGFYPSAAALAYAPAAYRAFVNRLWLTHIEPLDEVADQLQRFRPQILLGYASVLELLARESLAGRLALPALKQVINMSEPLSDGARRLVAEAFGLPVTNNYASGECMALCTGCPSGHGMHQQADWSILEVVDDHYRPVPPGRPGSKVLITNLYNRVQPFLRYELADVVTLSPTPCPCGSPLPLVLKVEGRTDDLLWIRDGDRYRQVHPYVFVDMLDECPEVGWYQIVQVERNRLLLRAAPAPGRRIGADDLHALLRRGLVRFGLGDLIRVDVELARVAPDPTSGKLRRITSRIGPPEREAAYVAAAS